MTLGAGTWSTNSNRYLPPSTVCTACRPGHVSDEVKRANYCTACPAGTYTSGGNPGGILGESGGNSWWGSTACDICPPNFYCRGYYLIVGCPEGTVSDAGAENVEACNVPTTPAPAILEYRDDSVEFTSSIGGVTPAEFLSTMQVSYTESVASVAGVETDQVEIISVTSTTRRTGGIDVDTTVSAGPGNSDGLLAQLTVAVSSGNLTATIVQNIQEDTGITVTVEVATVNVLSGCVNGVRDGIVDDGEECDEMSKFADAGCDTNCRVLANWTCVKVASDQTCCKSYSNPYDTTLDQVCEGAACELLTDENLGYKIEWDCSKHDLNECLQPDICTIENMICRNLDSTSGNLTNLVTGYECVCPAEKYPAGDQAFCTSSQFKTSFTVQSTAGVKTVADIRAIVAPPLDHHETYTTTAANGDVFYDMEYLSRYHIFYYVHISYHIFL
jgi:hypothetical protein